MNEAQEKLVERLTRELMDQGKLIEAGWCAFRVLCINPNAPQLQLAAMRAAFFTGAQHLFGSIMSGLDPDREPTEADERRMDLIDKELKAFIREYKKAA